MRPLNLSKRAAGSAFAIVLGLTGAWAYAQTTPGAPHGLHARAGMAGPGAGEEMAIVRLRNRLNLSTDQAAALDAILANTKAQGRTLHATAQPTIDQINAELAKAQPNLQTIAQLRDSLQPQREALHKATRDQLIGFYATLNATQQQVVIDALRKMAAWHTERTARFLAP